MSNLLNHNGYSGTVEVYLDNYCLFGTVLFVTDKIIYQGGSISELKSSFESAVEEYLETCKEIGKSPDKPFSGSFNVRVGPEIHKVLSLKAVEAGLSLNSFISKAITSYLEAKPPVLVNNTFVMHTLENKVFADQQSFYKSQDSGYVGSIGTLN